MPPSRKSFRRLIRRAERLGARQITLSAGEACDEFAEIQSVARYYGLPDWNAYLTMLCEACLEEARKSRALPVLDIGSIAPPDARRLKGHAIAARVLIESADDSLQHEIAHCEAPHLQFATRLAALETLIRLEVPAITGIRVGIGESPDSWAAAARAVSRLYEQHNYIQSFQIIPFFPKKYSAMALWPPVPDETYLQAVRSVREVLHPDIALACTIQNRESLLAPLLDLGVSDFGEYRLGTSEHIHFEVVESFSLLAAQCSERGCAVRTRGPLTSRFAARHRLAEPLVELLRNCEEPLRPPPPDSEEFSAEVV